MICIHVRENLALFGTWNLELQMSILVSGSKPVCGERESRLISLTIAGYQLPDSLIQFRLEMWGYMDQFSRETKDIQAWLSSQAAKGDSINNRNQVQVLTQSKGAEIASTKRKLCEKRHYCN